MDGRPYAGDPRQALARVVERYTARGLTPVVATELEFFLIDDSGKTLRVPPSPRSGKRRTGGETLSLRALDAFDAFFSGERVCHLQQLRTSLIRIFHFVFPFLIY